VGIKLPVTDELELCCPWVRPLDGPTLAGRTQMVELLADAQGTRKVGDASPNHGKQGSHHPSFVEEPGKKRVFTGPGTFSPLNDVLHVMAFLHCATTGDPMSPESAYFEVVAGD
jgi:hypothetical protein